MLATVSFLEAYATSYHYGSPTGRVPASPPIDKIAAALDRIETLIAMLRDHFAITPGDGAVAGHTAPRRVTET